MNLSTLPLPAQVAAILTASAEALRVAYWSTVASGRPPKLVACERCGSVLNARQRLRHSRARCLEILPEQD